MLRGMATKRTRRAAFLLVTLGYLPRPASAQPPAPTAPAGQPREVTAISYVPIDRSQRLSWIVGGTVGPRSLLVVGPLATVWQTAFNQPSEWQRTWSGTGRRYLHREADVAISNTIEAGLGALWGEEPRYIPSGRRGIGARARYAIKTAFVVQRPDGHLAPAWGRLAGNTVNNLIENAWLPPSATTPGQTLLRSALGFVSRLGGNAWEEFWPDVRRRFKK